MDKTQKGDPQARVLEIERSSIFVEPRPALRHWAVREKLLGALSPLRAFASSLIAPSLWMRVLLAVLAVLTGLVWFLSLARVFLSTGWQSLFHLMYAAGSGGFAIICFVAAFDLLSPEQLGKELEGRFRRKQR